MSESDYDQLLYDAPWLAHLQLTLNQSQVATFNFVIPSNDWETEKKWDISLRLRVEAYKQVVLLGLLSNFQ